MYIERFTDPKGSLFIKFPLLNNLINERKWRVCPEANEQYAATAIGKPLTLMLDKKESRYLDLHPFSPDPNATVQDHRDYAQKYAIGEIVDVTRESSAYKAASGEIPWFAVAKITDPMAAEELRKPATRLVPPAFSPGVWQLEGPDHNITKYEILHVAAVPDGAYGPKFVNIGKCNGDITTCAPLLRAASIAAHSGEAVIIQPANYKQRTGICPLEGFSSLHLKSGSLSNNMSFSSTNATTPGPGTFGTSEIKSPLDGTILSTQQQQQQPTTILPTRQKPTIKIRRMRMSEQEQPDTEEPQEPNGDVSENQPTTATNPKMLNNGAYEKRISDLEKKYQQREQFWATEQKRNEIKQIVPKSKFTDHKGRFRQKDWEAEVEQLLKDNVPIPYIQRIYEFETKLMEVPEVKRASAPFPSIVGSIPNLQSASSLESDENRIKSEKVLRLLTGEI
ncbi:MAG: hypothetical protein QOK66_00995 [Nitrososphaeraceae archaeon]|nr:hypothetical protein [Nitrososphaeraceae archaeon]